MGSDKNRPSKKIPKKCSAGIPDGNSGQKPDWTDAGISPKVAVVPNPPKSTALHPSPQPAVPFEEALQKLEQSQTELSEALDKEKQLNEIKSRFVAMASHEFRTPLTLMLGPLKQMEQGRLNESDTKKYTKMMRHNGERLLHLINQMLDLSKLESGKLHFVKTIRIVSILRILWIRCPVTGNYIWDVFIVPGAHFDSGPFCSGGFTFFASRHRSFHLRCLRCLFVCPMLPRLAYRCDASRHTESRDALKNLLLF